MKIEIAHPNDALLGVWKHVADLASAEMLDDYLNAPDFTPFVGTCVRGIDQWGIVFTGIFAEEGVVDIGCDSLWVGRQWHRNDPMYEFVKDLDFIDAWKTCKDGTTMLIAAYGIVSNVKIVEIGISLTRKIIHLATDSLPAQKVETLEEWTLGKSVDLTKVRDEIRESRSRTDAITRNIGYLVQFLTEIALYENMPEIVSSFTMTLMRITNAGVGDELTFQILEHSISNVVRKHISFYDIATGIIAHDLP